MLAISLAIIFVGLLIIFVGFAINRKGNTSFIAGNNGVFIPKDEKKLALRISINVIVFGIEVVLFPIIYHFIEISGSYIAILAVFHLLTSFLFMVLDQLKD